MVELASVAICYQGDWGDTCQEAPSAVFTTFCCGVPVSGHKYKCYCAVQLYVGVIVQCCNNVPQGAGCVRPSHWPLQVIGGGLRAINCKDCCERGSLYVVQAANGAAPNPGQLLAVPCVSLTSQVCVLYVKSHVTVV